MLWEKIQKHIPIIGTILNRPQSLSKDMVAGLTVALITIPQAIGFSVLVGIDVSWGLYTAIIAGLVTAFFGSSEFNISGTNSVLAVAVGILVASQGASALLALCVLIGLFQLLFGFLKLGTLARFVPLPVLVGFSTGVAFQLFLLQLPKAFDASIGNPETFLEIFIALWQKMVVAGHYNFSAFLVAGLTIVLLVWAQQIKPIKKLPLSLLVLMSVSAVTAFFHIDVKMIGEIPRALPSLTFPHELLNGEFLRHIITGALGLSLMASVESLATAQLATQMTGSKFDQNQELIGQGLANIAVGFTQGAPVTGAFSRTAANIKAGAQSRFASIFYALSIFLIVMVFADLARYIPIAALAGMLLVVAVQMIERHHIQFIFSATKTDKAIFLTTLGSTLFLDLITAVGLGIVLAVMLTLRKMTSQANIHEVTVEDYRVVKDDVKYHYCPQVQMVQIDAPLFFGMTPAFEDMMHVFHREHLRVVMLRMKNVPYIDASGVSMLEEVITMMRKKGVQFILCGVQDRVRKTLVTTGFDTFLWPDNFADSTEDAVKRFFDVYRSDDLCRVCTQRVFRECATLPQPE